MVDDDDSVQLSECCFDICEALETVIQGENAGHLNGPVGTALMNLERYVRVD